MYESCRESYNELEKITRMLGRFPTVKEWNLYAQKNKFLSNQSIEYIYGKNWNQLRDKILKIL